MEELFLKSIATVGFPAVVCFYVLFKVDKSVAALSTAIADLSSKVGEIGTLMDTQKHEMADMRRELGKVQDELQAIKHRVETVYDHKMSLHK